MNATDPNYRINGATYDEFKKRVIRFAGLGGFDRDLRPSQLLYAWLIGQGVGETAKQLLNERSNP